jgi:hypothetical protein
MKSRIAEIDEDKLHRIQQAIKWTVYSLLIINFAYYIYEDWDRALHVLTAESSLMDWFAEFATSIDELGWFLLLFMFELETYVLEDEDWKGWTAHVVRGVRLACYVMIAHTIFAYANAVIDVSETKPVDNVSSLCEMANDDVSFVHNLEYTAISDETCTNLSDASAFFWVAEDPVITDEAGLDLEKQHAIVDLMEASIWLLILLAIEIVVRLQSKGVTGGTIISTLNRAKLLMYTILIAFGAWWASLGHWLYFWDELVWIGGFAAIEMNLREWRDEILEKT